MFMNNTAQPALNQNRTQRLAALGQSLLQQLETPLFVIDA